MLPFCLEYLLGMHEVMKHVPEFLKVLRSRRYIKELKGSFESLEKEGRQSKGRAKFQSSSIFLYSIFPVLQ